MRMKAAAVAVAVTVAAYLAWLGWDQQRNPDGSGPYEAWQVAGLALTLAVVAAASSWRSADLSQAMVVAVMMAAALTVPVSIDWGRPTKPPTQTFGCWGRASSLVAPWLGCGSWPR